MITVITDKGGEREREAEGRPPISVCPRATVGSRGGVSEQVFRERERTPILLGALLLKVWCVCVCVCKKEGERVM